MPTPQELAPRPFWPASAIRWTLDAATHSHARAVGLLILVSLLLFLPGFFTIPPVDRDEARFAQATKQMAESGDYIDIRFQDDVRYKKPVGIYWLQSAALKAAASLGVGNARTKIWVYRLPSLLGAIGAVLLTYWVALAFTGRRAALIAGLALAGSALLGVEARLAKTDAMLLLTVVAAMGALARAYLQLPDSKASAEQARDRRAASWLLPFVFWTALAGGILLKGPLILLFVGLTVAALALRDRSLRWLMRLRPLPGLLWMCVLVLPWFLAIVARAGDSFFVESVGRDLLSKVATGQESHGAPPGLYLLLFWATFWIVSPLAILAAPSIVQQWREPQTFFLLAWLVPSWLVLEAVVTKLPHYVLPLYPAIAILVARAVGEDRLSRNPRLGHATLLWPIGAVLLFAISITLLAMFARQFGAPIWPLALLGGAAGLLAWLSFRPTEAELSFGYALLAALLMSVVAYGFVVPRLTPLFPSASIARLTTGADCLNPAYASAGYHEPSLVFLVGTETKLVDGAGAANFLNQGNCRIAFVEARQERAFVQRADAIGLRYAAVRRFDAVNISGGRQISVAVFRSQVGP